MIKVTNNFGFELTFICNLRLFSFLNSILRTDRFYTYINIKVSRCFCTPAYFLIKSIKKHIFPSVENICCRVVIKTLVNIKIMNTNEY